MDAVCVYHALHHNSAFYLTMHARILALYFPGARNGHITKRGYATKPLDSRVRETDSDEGKLF